MIAVDGVALYRAGALVDRLVGQAARCDQLVEPAVEVPDDIDDLARLFDPQVGPQIALADIQAGKLFELAADLIEAPPELGHFIGGRVEVPVVVRLIDAGGIVVVGLVVPGRRALVVPGAVADDRVEPLADRYAGAARGFLRRLARLLRQVLHVPGNARCHARIHGSTEEEREPDGPL